MRGERRVLRRNGISHSTGRLALFVAGGLALACSDPAEPPAPEVPRPRHLVIVSLDTMGAAHMGAYGHGGGTTPTFDALAAQGTLFENAFTSQTHTLVAHLSLMTGLHAQTHGATEKRRAASGATTLAEILAKASFANRAFTTVSAFASDDFGLGRGFDDFTDMIKGGLLANVQLHGPLREDAARARSDPEHRLFLFMHYYDPHSDYETSVPYDAPRQYLDRYVSQDLRGSVRGDTARLLELLANGGPDERQRRALHGLYDAGVAFTDQRILGLLVDWLRDTKLLDDTLLVVTADHGEEFFEHRYLLHTQAYTEISRIPLLLVGPGIPAGVRVENPVALVDVMPTILSVLGLPIPDQVQGQDLSPLLRGESVAPRGVMIDNMLAGRPRGMASWIEEVDGRRWSYLRRVQKKAGSIEWTGERELYDLGRDPRQRRNVASQFPEIAAELEQRLGESLLASREAGRALGVVDGPGEKILTDEEREALRGLGYIDP